jgi:Transposase/Transposase IS116/IS110/IS902 family
MLFVGVDWAEAHHDVCAMAEDGRVLGRKRVADSLAGLAELQALLAEHAEEPEDVVVGIEKDRGLIVTALLASGYAVYAVNPLASSRFRDRHHVSGAKSDPGDAKVLADMVRTDRHNLRVAAGDSDTAEGVKVLARAHQSAIWSRQRHVNALRNALKDYFPGALEAFGTDLAATDAVAVLAVAATPPIARALSIAGITELLRAGGRQRNLERRATEIHGAFQLAQLSQPPIVEAAYGKVAASSVRMIAAGNQQVAELEAALTADFEQHPDAKLILSLPGLGMVLGARVLGEFGDDPNRFFDAKCRRNYAGTSPITKASGRSRVVLARFARNRRLADALDQWAFCSLTHSLGARAYYDELRARGKTHRQAVRQLANRWVGILHACLDTNAVYDESVAWSQRLADAA